MKTLKQSNGKVIRMYSFEDLESFNHKRWIFHTSINMDIIFSGPKFELREFKDEEFWKGVVKEGLAACNRFGSF
jgi:hypothetical protein